MRPGVVSEAPAIRQHPVDQHISEGQVATFKVQATVRVGEEHDFQSQYTHAHVCGYAKVTNARTGGIARDSMIVCFNRAMLYHKTSSFLYM